ncbi:hypothetical protein ABTX61_15635, partial [Amycolatopsis japonica]|uniref:hypothetical protein n=1 Tax=Amycolatopsis japonica TaxID=208439 RepID=UPI0033191B01
RSRRAALTQQIQLFIFWFFIYFFCPERPFHDIRTGAGPEKIKGSRGRGLPLPRPREPFVPHSPPG